MQLVNLSATEEQELFVQAGAFGEDRIDSIRFDSAGDGYPGNPLDYRIPRSETVEQSVAGAGTSRIRVVLPPLTRITLQLDITRRAFTPAHTSFAHD